jgi:hypothetical protein
MQHGGVTSAAMGAQLVVQGSDPIRAAQALGLPDDPTALTLGQLDQLIAYYDALSDLYDEALTRLNALRDQTEAALLEYGGEVLGDLQGTAAAPLCRALTEAYAEYHSCCRELEAIAAYVKLLDDEERRPPSR